MATPLRPRTRRAMLRLVLTSLLLPLASAFAASSDGPSVTVELRNPPRHARTAEPVEVTFSLAIPAGTAPAAFAERARHGQFILTSGTLTAPVATQVGAAELGEAGKLNIRATFLADAAPEAIARYRFSVDPGSPAPAAAGLSVAGDGVVRTIENEFWKMQTHDPSGQIDQIDLKFATRPSFRFAHGTLHWNPDFIVIPDDYPKRGYKWWYAHHFDKPETTVEEGPIYFQIRRSQLIPNQENVWMEVMYRFYAGQPWFLMESRMEAKKDTRTFAIRNDELAFGRTDFTHAAWRTGGDFMPGHLGEIGSTSLFHELRQGAHVLGSALPPNLPWFSFVHHERGYGVGTIRLASDNTNVLTGQPSPIYNSHTVISEHDEGLYWYRSLVYSPRKAEGDLTQEDINRFIVKIPAGSSYFERNAYLFFEPGPAPAAFGPVDDLWKKLSNPLEARVIE